MGFDRMRLEDASRFHDTELPDWYHAAVRIGETEEDFLGCALEIRFWPSEIHDIFMLIETPMAFVEQVVVPNPADWLPFLSRHLAPIMAVSNQCSLIALHGKIGNAFIALARHGEGRHVDHETGLSRIDLDNDRDRRRAQQARSVIEWTSREGSALRRCAGILGAMAANGGTRTE